jgi:hypothetical protein
MKVNAVALGLVGVLGPGLKIYQFGFSPEKSLTKNCIFRYGWGDKPAGYQRFFNPGWANFRVVYGDNTFAV